MVFNNEHTIQIKDKFRNIKLTIIEHCCELKLNNFAKQFIFGLEVNHHQVPSFSQYFAFHTCTLDT